MSEPADRKKKPELPPLGPPFLAPDDAARWAHELIGERRDREYGGVIFKQGDRYYATTPVPGREGIFDHNEIFARDANNVFVAPRGFSCVALYHSHPVVPGKSQFSAEQVELLLSFFTASEIMFSIINRRFASAHYLSGLRGALIKYVASGSATEQQLFDRLDDKISKPSYKYFEEPIEQLAAAGELWVVVPSSVWGGVRGRVTQEWVRGSPVAALPKPQPFFTQLYDKPADAIASALSNVSPSPIARHWGVMLKHVEDEAYAASLPSVEVQRLPQAESPFPQDAQGIAQLPARFRIEGIYLSSSNPGKLPAQGAWLYRNFFFPAEIAQGVMQSRSDARSLYSSHGFSLYSVTREGALLKYRCSGNDRETRLMGADANGRPSATGLERQILAARLTPLEFVRQVAQAGELQVLRTGGMWDRQGVVDVNWLPYARRQPRLNPAFATADDAARHAHAQVAYHREHDYVSLILQRSSDGCFVAIDPVVAKTARFALNAVWPVQEQGVPEGYTLLGLFASRGRNAGPDSVERSATEAAVFEQMFSDDDIYRLLTGRNIVDLAYLSGSRDSLLRFSSAGLVALAEQELLTRVTPDQGSSIAAREWAQGDALPSAFVRELAFTSHLVVLEGSALWGAPGSLALDWVPYDAGDFLALPAVPRTGAVCATTQEAVLQAHARVADGYTAETAGMGLLLKHQHREQYVATQRVPADQLNQLEARCENALALLNAGFVVDSVYYSSRRVPSGVSEQARWLHRHFLEPDELFAALYKSDCVRRFALTRPIILHIACLDGALLHYELEAGSRLFQLPANKCGATVLTHTLKLGALSARDFIAKVAREGTLKVNLISECWDQAGVVGPRWLPFAHITQRYLSPAFATVDDAVRYVHRALGTQRDQVYGGLVLKSVGGVYVVTEPLAVHVENFDPNWIRLHALVEKGQFLGGSSIVACYHTRAPSLTDFAASDQERAVYNAMFSTHFLQSVLGNEDWPQTASPRTDYLLCADGALLRFRGNEAARRPGLLVETERNLRDGSLLPSEWVRRVADVGDLQVLEGSQVWGVAQKVTAAWTPYPREKDPWLSPAVQADLPMSPLFTQINDAVRHAHRLAGARERRTFGWVLQVPGNLYMVSQPTPLWGGRSVGLDHLVTGGALPTGYCVIGVYLCTQAPAAGATDDVQQSFLTPIDLELGLSAAMQPGASQGAGVLLFISCADGALLKLDHFRRDNELLQTADRYSRRLQKGDVSTADYVRKVARTGVLNVLVPSKLWSATGVVSQQWQPFRAAGLSHPVDNRLVLGPLFLQADDAARHAQQGVSGEQDKAWLGGILTKAQNGFVAIEPLEDTDAVPTAEQRLFWTEGRNADVPQPLPVPELPEGFRVMATHQFYRSDFAPEAGQLGENLISWSYLYNYTWRLRQFGLEVTRYYLSTRDGALLKYTVDNSAGSYQLEMIEIFNHKGIYTAAYLLDQLILAKCLTVVHTGSFWRRRGPVISSVIVPVTTSPLSMVPTLWGRERDEF